MTAPTPTSAPMQGLAAFLRYEAHNHDASICRDDPFVVEHVAELRRWAAEVDGAQRWFAEVAAAQQSTSAPPAAQPVACVEDVFERYASAGYSLALVFDDDGRWAVSDAGSQPLPDGNDGHTKPTAIGSYVTPEQWKPSINGAVAFYVAAHPLEAAAPVAKDSPPADHIVDANEMIAAPSDAAPATARVPLSAVTDAMIDAAGAKLWPKLWLWRIDPQREVVRDMLQAAIEAAHGIGLPHAEPRREGQDEV